MAPGMVIGWPHFTRAAWALWWTPWSRPWKLTAARSAPSYEWTRWGYPEPSEIPWFYWGLPCGNPWKSSFWRRKSMKIIVLDEKSMNIIILKRNIHENHHYKKNQWTSSFWRGKSMKLIIQKTSMNTIILKRKTHENHCFFLKNRKIYEHHHFL